MGGCEIFQLVFIGVNLNFASKFYIKQMEKLNLSK